MKVVIFSVFFDVRLEKELLLTRHLPILLTLRKKPFQHWIGQDIFASMARVINRLLLWLPSVTNLIPSLRDQVRLCGVNLDPREPRQECWAHSRTRSWDAII